MRDYRVRGNEDFPTFISIVEEFDDSYRVVIRKVTESTVKEKTEMLSKHLFELCIRTGYMSAVSSSQMQIA